MTFQATSQEKFLKWKKRDLGTNPWTQVKTIDVCEYLQHLEISEKDKVIVKVDIESAEEVVLTRMLQCPANILNIIDYVFFESVSKHYSNPASWTAYVHSAFARHNIKVGGWS